MLKTGRYKDAQKLCIWVPNHKGDGLQRDQGENIDQIDLKYNERFGLPPGGITGAPRHAEIYLNTFMIRWQSVVIYEGVLYGAREGVTTVM